MCILIVKQQGVNFPPVSHIEESCNQNPDGFGFALSEGEGDIFTYRTMSKKEFIKTYKKTIKKYDANKTSMIIHARYATHGSKCRNNCHCWVKESIAFAHNGVLSVKNRGNMTDSETFFEDIFIPIYKAEGWDAALRASEAVRGTSKFAYLFNDGAINYYGDFHEDKGVLYSNYSYVKTTYSYTRGVGRSGFSVRGVNTLIDDDYDDFSFEDWYSKRYGSGLYSSSKQEEQKCKPMLVF